MFKIYLIYLICLCDFEYEYPSNFFKYKMKHNKTFSFKRLLFFFKILNMVYNIVVTTCKRYLSHLSHCLALIYMFVIELQQYNAICEKLNFPYEKIK